MVSEGTYKTNCEYSKKILQMGLKKLRVPIFPLCRVCTEPAITRFLLNSFISCLKKLELHQTDETAHWIHSAHELVVLCSSFSFLKKP